jgi:hypothetical protein
MKPAMPRRLPCKICGIKPKMIIKAFGYSDKDDRYTLQCSKCKKIVEANYDLLPNYTGQEYDVVHKWNKENA